MKKRASIVLISLLIISAFTIFLALSASEITLSTGFINLDENESKYSYYLAESCLEEALLRVESNPGFTSTTINYGNDTCTATYASNVITITVNYGIFTNTYRANVSLTTNGQVNNIKLIDWSEI